MIDPRPTHRFRADIALLTTAVLWGANIAVVKSSISHMDPLSFNALRMILSTLVLGLLAWAESRMNPTPSQPWSWRRGFVFAVLNGLCYPFLFIFGIDRTTAGNSALLLASMPIWTAAISFFMVSERLSRVTWAGLLVSLVGTISVIVAGSDVSFSSTFFIGNLLMLGAAMAWSASTVVSGPLLKSISPLKLAFWSSLIATPIQLVVTIPELPGAVQQLTRPGLLLALVYSGTMSTGLAYATWHYGVRQLGGSHASVYQNVVTLVAVLTAWYFLDEPILRIQIVGGLILFVGLFLMRKGRHRSPPTAPLAKQTVLTQES